MEVEYLNIKKVIHCIGIFIGIILIGWGFVEVMTNFTWMVYGIDYLLWAMLYLAGLIGTCTYLVCSNLYKK